MFLLLLFDIPKYMSNIMQISLLLTDGGTAYPSGQTWNSVGTRIRSDDHYYNTIVGLPEKMHRWADFQSSHVQSLSIELHSVSMWIDEIFKNI